MLPGLVRGHRIPSEAESQAQPSRNYLAALLPCGVYDEIWTSNPLSCPVGVHVNEMRLLGEWGQG